MIEHIELTLAPYDIDCDALCVQGNVAVIDYQIADKDGRLSRYLDVVGMSNLLSGCSISRWYASDDGSPQSVIAAFDTTSRITSDLDYGTDIEWYAEFCGLVDIA